MTSLPADLVAAVATGQGAAKTRALGRLITAAVDDPASVEALRQVVAAGACRRPRVIGITGPPGAGKSSLTDALVARWLQREPTHRFLVAAVDPSSPFTGGSILGDRVRMMRHALNEQVFVRSLATRGELGGLCRGIDGVILAAALWGADTVLIETVGVGQNEIEIARWADCTCLVLAPGQGDGVQWLKSGLMEIGDVFVVNKADRDDAETLAAQLMTAVERMHAAPRPGMRSRADRLPTPPPVLMVSAMHESGLDPLVSILSPTPEPTAHV